MAVAKTQGQGGFLTNPFVTVFFLALWLIATTLLVLLYMDQDKKTSAVAEMEEQLRKVIGPDGRKLPQFTAAKPGSGTTMVDLLENARARSAELAVGDPAADVATVQSRLDAQLDEIRASRFVENPSVFDGVSYDSALSALFTLFKTEGEARDEAEAGLESMTVQMNQLRDAQARQKEEFDEQAQQWQAQLAAIDQTKTESLQKHDEQVESFDELIEGIKQQCSDDIQAQRSEIAKLQRDYDDLFARYQELKDKTGQSQVAPLPLATARVADGKVLTAKPGDPYVYIDLGASDHLTLGLEFAVYDAMAGIPEDGRAKARIEVVGVDKDTATCRVEQQLRNEMIMEGDLIANPIYDRHRPIRFYVMGNFDLDGDGREDPDGIDRIKSLIKMWGGVLDSDLSAQVDFVVLGGAPHKPANESDYGAEDTERDRQQRRAYDEYMAQVKTAEALAVPRLTQSVLLNFLGYNSAQAIDFGTLAATARP